MSLARIVTQIDSCDVLNAFLLGLIPGDFVKFGSNFIFCCVDNHFVVFIRYAPFEIPKNSLLHFMRILLGAVFNVSYRLVMYAT